jgi:hypothetical protein
MTTGLAAVAAAADQILLLMLVQVAQISNKKSSTEPVVNTHGVDRPLAVEVVRMADGSAAPCAVSLGQHSTRTKPRFAHWDAQ